MKKPVPEPASGNKDAATLPIGQHEGDGTNAVQHAPDPSAEPLPDGVHRYVPGTGYSHGND